MFNNYGEDSRFLNEDVTDDEVELIAMSEMGLLSDEDREFVLENADLFIEAKIFSNKGNLVKFTKEADADRRKTIMAYKAARDNNDVLWAKFVKANKEKKLYKSKILTKYGAKSERKAEKAQKEYVKRAKKVKSSVVKKKDSK